MCRPKEPKMMLSRLLEQEKHVQNRDFMTTPNVEITVVFFYHIWSKTTPFLKYYYFESTKMEILPGICVFAMYIKQ